jgi:septal ring factor EnvC (AmiA/AmiB activator)
MNLVILSTLPAVFSNEKCEGRVFWQDLGLNKASLERQKQFEAEIKSLQEQMRIDKHRSDLKEQVAMLRKEVDEEKAGRCEWTLRKAEIDSQLAKLRGGTLAGVQINGRRPVERPLGNDPGISGASISPAC